MAVLIQELKEKRGIKAMNKDIILEVLERLIMRVKDLIIKATHVVI